MEVIIPKMLLEVLNSSEDHKGLFNILLEEHKQIHGGDFNPVNIVYNTLNNERYDAVEKNMRCVDEVNFIRL